MLDQAILSNSHILYKHDQIIFAIDQLAIKLNGKFSGKKVLLLPILTGAIPFVGILIPKLTFTVVLDYLHVSRYQNNIGQDKVSLKHEPSKNLILNMDVLVVDDILDEGLTMEFIYKRLALHQPKSITNVALFNKKLDKKKCMEADFYGLEVENEYVYGFGLDYNGLGRNIPDLYAINNSGLNEKA